MFPSTFPAEPCYRSDSRIRANLAPSFAQNDSGGVSLARAKLSRGASFTYSTRETGLSWTAAWFVEMCNTAVHEGSGLLAAAHFPRTGLFIPSLQALPRLSETAAHVLYRRPQAKQLRSIRATNRSGPKRWWSRHWSGLSHGSVSQHPHPAFLQRFLFSLRRNESNVSPHHQQGVLGSVFCRMCLRVGFERYRPWILQPDQRK